MKRHSIVAIVGKPNSGKSTLFNRLVGGRKAITHKTPGVTRDRMEEFTSWNGIEFKLIDTGGFSLSTEDPLQSQITDRILKTVSEASVVIFLVDIDTGPTDEDENLIRALRDTYSKIILTVNKVESETDKWQTSEFYSLGFEKIFAISALHGTGVGDLLDEVVSRLPRKPSPGKTEDALKIAIVGKPNVGKSSLVNSLTGEEKHIVSQEPGTTRDSINIRLKYYGREIVLVDTAGVKRRSKTSRGLDSISSMKSIRSIEASDIVLVMIDVSNTDISRQDTRIASFAHKARKGIIVLVNKWDLVDKDTNTAAEYTRKVREAMPFLSYAPVLFVSATEKIRLSKIFPLCLRIEDERNKRIGTPELNKLLETAVTRNPPKFFKTGTGKIFYGTQTGIKPPTFTLFVNKSAYFPRSYVRYINNQIRNMFTFEGTAVKISLKSKEPSR